MKSLVRLTNNVCANGKQIHRTEIGIEQGLSFCARRGNTECEQKEKLVDSMFYIANSANTRYS